MSLRSTTVTRVSVDDFLTGPFPRGAWLIDGEVVVNDPTLLHQEVCARLLRALWAWIERSGGHAGYGGNWLVAPDTVLKPDVWWITPARRASIDLAATIVTGPPDLAVEVRSPGTWTIDLGRKRERYEAAGLPELWLVDPPARSVLVYRRSSPSAPAFDEFAELMSGEVLTTPVLPGFAVEVASLFPTD